jgi:uncharacterized membrane protein YagU involved in acid resistance
VNVSGWLAAGFAGTVVLTLLLSGMQAAGLTRMSLPYLLGTMVVPDRDRARVVGIGLHLLNGWVFSLAYVALFHALHRFAWWAGAVTGLVHGLFVIMVAMPALPGIHPRMASPSAGPAEGAPLEPPGFLALHYGFGTPAATLVAHVVFGAVVAALYVPR